jgi:hypothetical protein
MFPCHALSRTPARPSTVLDAVTQVFLLKQSSGTKESCQQLLLSCSAANHLSRPLSPSFIGLNRFCSEQVTTKDAREEADRRGEQGSSDTKMLGEKQARREEERMAEVRQAREALDRSAAAEEKHASERGKKPASKGKETRVDQLYNAHVLPEMDEVFEHVQEVCSNCHSAHMLFMHMHASVLARF